MNEQPIEKSISVDAACSGNPGPVEYKGVNTFTKAELFKQGPFQGGTNNLGEFLALVHAIAYCKKHNLPNTAIYSDSVTAISWVKAKSINTNMARTEKNKELFTLIDRALDWLKKNSYKNPVLKWNTREWGEIGADYGRKQ